MVAAQPITEELLNKLYWDRRLNPITKYEINTYSGIGPSFKIDPRFDVLHGKKRVGYNDYVQLYYENEEAFDFEPRTIPQWDKHFEDYLNHFRRHNALTNPRHRHFEGYEPLRQNIAMLGRILASEPPVSRNSDLNKQLIMKTMAKQAASTLKWTSFWRAVTNFLTLRWSAGNDVSGHRFGIYGDEHAGAAKLYAKLYQNQGKFILNPISWFTGRFRHPNLGLPHPEESPFSSKDMTMAKYIEKREDEIGMEDRGNRLKAKGVSLARLAATSKPGHISKMRPGDKEEALWHARKILKLLQDINYGVSNREMGNRENDVRELEAAEYSIGLFKAYQTLLAGVSHQNPDALHDPKFIEAQRAMGQLSYIVLQEAEKAYLKDKNDPNAAQLLQELMEEKSKLPEEFQLVGNTNKKVLIKTIEQAMEYAAEYQGLRAQQARTRGKGMQLAPEAAVRVEESIAKMQGSIDGNSARINGIGGAAARKLESEIREINTLNAERGSASRKQAPQRQTSGNAVNV